jgi:hypothetical protein
MFTISQGSDGFLWFSSQNRGVYRFDGVRFLSWPLPSKNQSPVFKIVGDRKSGVWALSQGGIAHIDHGLLVSDFKLPGLLWAAGISVEADVDIVSQREHCLGCPVVSRDGQRRQVLRKV